MEQLSAFSSLADVLHVLSQVLLIPDIILLMAFAGYALFCIGSILMEYFTERRAYRIAMPKFLNSLMKADERNIPEVIRTSGLLNRQKSALLTVFDYRTLHDDALIALIRRTEYAEEMRYERIIGRNNTAAKISPMLGLMGTLIPLGPGVAALGQADPSMLSASLLVAFDTTVAGLAVAAVCLAVGKIRSTWYGDYQSSLESAMATLLQKIEDMRTADMLHDEEPSNYAVLFEKGLHAEKVSSTTVRTDDQSQQQNSRTHEEARSSERQAGGLPTQNPSPSDKQTAKPAANNPLLDSQQATTGPVPTAFVPPFDNPTTQGGSRG